MTEQSIFFYLVPTMFVLFGLALAAIAFADRTLMAARWGALAFFIAAAGVTLDALRPPNQELLRYIALLSHFVTLCLMLQAFAARHGRNVPRLSVAAALLGCLIFIPPSPISDAFVFRVIAVQVIASAILLPGIVQVIEWARRTVVDRMILVALSLSFLSYMVRAGLYAGDTGSARDAGPLFQNVYNVVFHATTAVIGFAVGVVLLVAIGVDALMRESRESKTDPLTQIGNRRALDEAIDADERGERRCGAVIAADLDRFKQVNDRYGHAAGDVLLVAVAQTLDRVLGQFGTLCRIGGEEFVLLLDEEYSDATEALATTAGKAIAAIRLEGALAEYRPTACIGFHVRGEGTTIAEALNSADRAVYRGKADGRNKVISAVGKPGDHITLSAV